MRTLGFQLTRASAIKLLIKIFLLLSMTQFLDVDAAAKNSNIESSIELYSNQAGKYYKDKNYDKAIVSLGKLIDLIEKDQIPRVALLSDAYSVLGRIYREKKDWKNAEKSYLSAIEVGHQVPEAYYEHKYINLYGGLAVVYMLSDKNEDAEYYFKKALENAGDAKLNTQDTLFVSYINEYLGDIEFNKKLFELAEQHFLEAVRHAEKYYLLDQESDERIKQKIVLTVMERGDLKRVKRLLSELIPLQENLFDDKNKKLMFSYYTLAAISYSDGDFVKAESLYKTIISRLDGSTELLLARAYSGLGRLYKSQEKFSEAESALNQGVHFAEKILGKEHSLNFDFKSDLAGLYITMKQYDKAEQIYLSSQQSLFDTHGENSLPAAEHYSWMASLYLRTDRMAIAEEYVDKAISIANSQNIKPPFLVNVYETKASIQVLKTEYSSAEESLKKAIELSSMHYGEKNKTTTILKVFYADLLSVKGDKEKQEELRKRLAPKNTPLREFSSEDELLI